MKKTIVSLMLLLPLCLAAQEIKIAFVNTNNVFDDMPEVSDMENKIASMRKQMEDFLLALQKDYQTKYSEFMAKQDSLPENIRTMYIQEINELQTRYQNYYEASDREIQQKAEELIIPIRDKMQKAIDQVGEENGYTYIINPEALLFRSKSAIDATDKVRAKLGLN